MPAIYIKKSSYASYFNYLLGSKSGSIGLSPNSWTKFVSNFEATSNEVNQDLKLYLNGAGSVYVDNVSLTQAYDMWINLSAKLSNDNASAILQNSNGLSSTFGLGYGIYNGDGRIYFDVFSETGTTGLERSVLKTVLPNNVWNNIGLKIDHVSGIEYGKVENLLSGPFTTIGKIIPNSCPVYISTYYGNMWFLNGQIGQMQFIRFTNIGQSNFNPQTYKIGQSVSGGGAEVVLWFDPSKDGSSIENTIKDWSGNNNNLLASSIDLTNRVLTH